MNPRIGFETMTDRKRELIANIGGVLVIPVGALLGLFLFVVIPYLATHPQPRKFYNSTYGTFYGDPRTLPCEPYPRHPSEWTNEQWMAWDARCPRLRVDDEFHGTSRWATFVNEHGREPNLGEWNAIRNAARVER